MPHWNPIITTMEQNELLLTWSAASWFRVAAERGYLPSLRHGCTFLFLSYSHSPRCIQFCLTAPTTPTYRTHTHTHCYFRNAGHYRSQPLRPIRVWQPHLTRQAVPQLRRSNKHIRALRADGLYRHEVKNRAGEAWDNDIAGWENWMKRNKECDRGNGITFWAHHAIFCLMGYLPEECKDNL